MRRLIIIIAFLVWLYAFLLYVARTETPDVVAPSTSVEEFSDYIAEDDPRWDCRTMGNRICGP